MVAGMLDFGADGAAFNAETCPQDELRLAPRMDDVWRSAVEHHAETIMVAGMPQPP